MHHLRGMGAPWHWCRTGGEGVCFMRSECRTTNGQGVVLARRTQILSYYRNLPQQRPNQEWFNKVISLVEDFFKNN